MSTLQAATLAACLLILAAVWLDFSPRRFLRAVLRAVAWTCFGLAVAMALAAYNLLAWSE
jgi:hypothetical protein